jgi:ribosomal protein S1
VDDSLSVTGAGGIVVDVTDDSVVVDATAIEDDIAAIDTRLTALEDGELRYEPLTNGDIANPELVFAAGDVIMVKVTN